MVDVVGDGVVAGVVTVLVVGRHWLYITYSRKCGQTLSKVCVIMKVLTLA